MAAHPNSAVASALTLFTMPNGLRVVLCPDRSAPVIGVAVIYDVGMRSEPQGRTGFAHLFEHLMFQGSASLEKLAHFRYVQGAGGTFNGTTHMDYTDYYEMLPSNALERVLFLESDRMRSPRLTEENLRNQIDVVKEEIRVNVLNRPYGGFPWLKLPQVMFDTFPNAHDGYGSFVDLDAATVDDAADFFARYYAAGNAVLSVVGDLDVDSAAAMVEAHFGDVPARPAPERAVLAEPDITGERYQTYVDNLAPLPAFAAAWRVPDPVSDLSGYLPYVVLAEVLTDGDASRLVQRLVLTDRSVTSVGGYVGFMGDPYDVRDPTAMVVQAHLPPGGDVAAVLAATAQECRRLAEDGLAPGELDRTVARMASYLLRDADTVLGRALHHGVGLLLRGDAAMLDSLPALLAEVTHEQVRAAAATLVPARRAVAEIIPGAGNGGNGAGNGGGNGA